MASQDGQDVAQGTPDQSDAEKLVEKFEFDTEPTPADEPAADSSSTPTEKTEEADSGKPAPNQHAPLLVRRAKDIGVDEDTIARLPSDQLDELVYHLEAQERRLYRERPAAPVTAQAEPQEDEEETSLVDDELREEVNPKLVSAIEQLEKQNRELKKAVKGIGQSSQQRDTAALDQQLESFFATRPELFGVGTARDLHPKGEAMKKRMAIVRGQADEEGSFRERLEAATRAIYGQPAAKKPEADPAITKQLEDRNKKWAENGTATPTQRAPRKEEKGLKAAKAMYERDMRELAAKQNGTADEHNGQW